jgi:hypothetical protein
MYGWRFFYLQSFYTQYFTTWTEKVLPAWYVHSRPQAGGEPLIWNNPIGLNYGVEARATKAYQFASPPTLTAYQPDLAAAGETFQLIATAVGPTSNDWLIAWTRLDDEQASSLGSMPCAGGRIATSRNAGSTWTVRNATPVFNLCAADAPTATWDPTTSLYLVMWGGGDALVEYVTYDVDGNAVGVGNLFGDQIADVHTAVAACGPSSMTENCLLVWDGEGEYGCLTYMQTHIGANGKLVPAQATTDCWWLERTPGLIYRGQIDAVYPFGLLFKQKESLFSTTKHYNGNFIGPVITLVTDTPYGILSGALHQYASLVFPAGTVYYTYAYTGQAF